MMRMPARWAIAIPSPRAPDRDWWCAERSDRVRQRLRSFFWRNAAQNLPRGLLQHIGAHTRTSLIDRQPIERMVRRRQQIDRRMAGQQCNIGMAAHGIEQGDFDGPARGVGGMDDTRQGCGRLPVPATSRPSAAWSNCTPARSSKTRRTAPGPSSARICAALGLQWPAPARRYLPPASRENRFPLP